MKKKWYSNLELFRFSLIVLLIGEFFIGISSLKTSSDLISTILQALSQCGVLFKKLFPLAFAINFIAVKHNNGIACFIAFVSYLVLEITTMFVADNTLPAYCFSSLFNISLTSQSGALVTRMPLNLGLIGSIIIIIIVDNLYKITSKRYNYGFLTFLDNDSLLFIYACVATAAVGAVVSLLAPFVINLLDSTLKFVSTNSNNPACMAIYGLIDKSCELLQIGNVTKDNFWFGSLGGSYIDLENVTHYGDVNIWTAQIAANSVAETTGRFISARYILNIFIAPALVIGYYFNIKDKMDRKRITGLAVLAILVSLISGSTICIEYLLLFTAPALFFCHLALSSIIYMLVAVASLPLGYSFIKASQFATAGNIIDFINYARLAAFNKTTMQMSLIGGIGFFLYILIIHIYYSVLAFDFLDNKNSNKHIDEIVRLCGSTSNIKMITSTATDLVVVPYDKSKINVDELLNTSIYRVKERYFGYYLQIGPSSHAIARRIKKLIK